MYMECFRGLCGIFDGDKTNDFHDRDGRIMDLKMYYGQIDRFPEQWRLVLNAGRHFNLYIWQV